MSAARNFRRFWPTTRHHALHFSRELSVDPLTASTPASLTRIVPSRKLIVPPKVGTSVCLGFLVPFVQDVLCHPRTLLAPPVYCFCQWLAKSCHCSAITAGDIDVGAEALLDVIFCRSSVRRHRIVLHLRSTDFVSNWTHLFFFSDCHRVCADLWETSRRRPWPWAGVAAWWPELLLGSEVRWSPFRPSIACTCYFVFSCLDVVRL